MNSAPTHLELLIAHDAVVSTRCMMTAPPYGSPEEREAAVATAQSLYEVMWDQALRCGDLRFLDELALWMEPCPPERSGRANPAASRNLTQETRMKLLRCHAEGG